MLFVTYHKAVSNVYAYDDNGNLLNPDTPNVLNSVDNKLDELRGIYFTNNYSYVINGGKDVSDILCFRGRVLTTSALLSRTQPMAQSIIRSPWRWTAKDTALYLIRTAM